MCSCDCLRCCGAWCNVLPNALRMAPDIDRRAGCAVCQHACCQALCGACFYGSYILVHWNDAQQDAQNSGANDTNLETEAFV